MRIELNRKNPNSVKAHVIIAIPTRPIFQTDPSRIIKVEGLSMSKQQTDLEFLKSSGPVEAEMIQEVLQNNGIDCTLQGDAAANIVPATGDLDEVRIWVKPEDAAKAKELLEAFFTPVENSEALEDGDDGTKEQS